MKIVIEMTELDYSTYVKMTERNAFASYELELAQEKLEIKQGELEELAGCVLKAYQNPEDGSPEKGISDSTYLDRAKKLAEEVFNRKLRTVSL